MVYAASAIEALTTVHSIFLTLESALAPVAAGCPLSSTIDTIQSIDSWDYVIVGSGEAGSILAYRLAETNANVLVLEEGGCPPLESALSGYFTTLPNTTYDRQMPIYDDGYSCQNLKLDKAATAGKMLGGTGSLNHLIYVPAFAADYDAWQTAANDGDEWGADDMAYYFAKGERVLDSDVLSQNTTLHGTCGPTKLKKQTHTVNQPLIEAHEELMFPYVADAYSGVSVSEPLYFIADCIRQSGHEAYLSKISALNSNVKFLTGAVVTKVLFNGTTANGVQFTYSNATYSVSASKVIISAGGIKTTQLLQVSGVGDKDIVEGINVESVIDNKEVGQNVMDHLGVLTAISWESNETTASADPREFPVPVVTVYDSINKRSSQPGFQNIGLYFTPAHSGLLQLLTEGFKLKDDLVDTIYESNIGRTMWLMVNNLQHPESRGSVTATSDDINDNPTIKLGLLSNATDLDLMAEHLTQYVGPLLSTTNLQSLNASLVDLGFCSDYTALSLEFWKCYTVAMSTNMWHFSGGAAIGKVVDSKLNVIGATNLKVCDASIFPSMTTGNIGGVVRALAEKCADIIKNEDGLTENVTVCKPGSS